MTEIKQKMTINKSNIREPLKNTLSDNGDVNRGICSIKDGLLEDVYKRQQLLKGIEAMAKEECLANKQKGN